MGSEMCIRDRPGEPGSSDRYRRDFSPHRSSPHDKVVMRAQRPFDGAAGKANDRRGALGSRGASTRGRPAPVVRAGSRNRAPLAERSCPTRTHSLCARVRVVSTAEHQGDDTVIEPASACPLVVAARPEGGFDTTFALGLRPPIKRRIRPLTCGDGLRRKTLSCYPLTSQPGPCFHRSGRFRVP